MMEEEEEALKARYQSFRSFLLKGLGLTTDETDGGEVMIGEGGGERMTMIERSGSRRLLNIDDVILAAQMALAAGGDDDDDDDVGMMTQQQERGGRRRRTGLASVRKVQLENMSFSEQLEVCM